MSRPIIKLFVYVYFFQFSITLLSYWNTNNVKNKLLIYNLIEHKNENYFFICIFSFFKVNIYILKNNNIKIAQNDCYWSGTLHYSWNSLIVIKGSWLIWLPLCFRGNTMFLHAEIKSLFNLELVGGRILCTCLFLKYQNRIRNKRGVISCCFPFEYKCCYW